MILNFISQEISLFVRNDGKNKNSSFRVNKVNEKSVHYFVMLSKSKHLLISQEISLFV